MSITNGYADLTKLKSDLDITDVQDDLKLENIVEAVSRWIDDFTERRFYTVSETRYYTPSYTDKLVIDDLVSLTTLKTDHDGDRTYEITWSATDYDLYPYNAQLESQPEPYTQIHVAPRGSYTFPRGLPKSVEIVGSFGYSATVPKRVVEACRLQSERLFKRKDAIFGVTGSAEMGQLIAIPKLDPDVQQLIQPLVRRKNILRAI